MSTSKLTTTAGEIEALSITAFGSTTLKIFDIDNIPENIDQRFCPQMFPDAANWVTEFACERSTMGVASAAMHTFRYRLNYIVAVMPAGSTRGLKDIYANLVSTAEAIITKITVSDDLFTVANINPIVGPFIAVQDQTGQAYHGFNVAFDIEEFE
jgi:hypothetical protein